MGYWVTKTLYPSNKVAPSKKKKRLQKRRIEGWSLCSLNDPLKYWNTEILIGSDQICVTTSGHVSTVEPTVPVQSKKKKIKNKKSRSRPSSFDIATIEFTKMMAKTGRFEEAPSIKQENRTKLTGLFDQFSQKRTSFQSCTSSWTTSCHGYREYITRDRAGTMQKARVHGALKLNIRVWKTGQCPADATFRAIQLCIILLPFCIISSIQPYKFIFLFKRPTFTF